MITGITQAFAVAPKATSEMTIWPDAMARSNGTVLLVLPRVVSNGKRVLKSC